MKKLPAFALALACVVLVLTSCGTAETGGASEVNNATVTKAPDDINVNSNIKSWTIKTGYTDEAAKELSQEDTATISDVLSEGDWIDDLTKCEGDCVITTADGDVFYYHSACGTFNDNKNYRSLSTTEEEMALINSVLNQYCELETDD